VLFPIAIASADDAETEKDISNIKPEMTVTAVELYYDYQKNGLAADEKYKDKVIIVEGSISEIDKDLGDIYCSLNTADYDWVRCYFSKSHAKEAANLEKKMKISVKGKVEGKFGAYLNLRGCTIEKIK